MHSKKLSGYILSLDYYDFLSHNLFLFLPIIRLLVHFPLPRLSLLARNILISAITLFVIMSKQDHFRPPGYRRKTCQQIFLQNLFLLFFFIVIVMFSDFLIHRHNFLFYYYFYILFFSFFFSFRPDGGVLTLGLQVRMSRAVLT